MSDNKAKKSPQIFAAVCVCMGSMAAGSTLGWLANTQADLDLQMLNGVRVHPATMGGFIGSFHLLGATLMCIPTGILCDKVGRKMAMLLMIVPFIIGWASICFAQHVGMILFGRLVTGMSMGAFCVAAPMYTSEIAETEIRGALGTFFQLFLVCGNLYANLSGLAHIKTATIICWILPFIFVLLILLQPESPRYWLMKNKDEKAEKALQKLRGKHYDVSKEISDTKSLLAEEKAQHASLRDSLKKKAVKKSIIIVFGSQFCQQLSGVNAVFAFTTSIFVDAGFSNFDPEYATLIVGGVNVVATVASVFLVEKGGRKFLMLLSSGVGGIAIFILGIMMIIQTKMDKEDFKSYACVSLIAVLLYVLMFAVGLGPVPWLLASEVFPADIKAPLSAGAGTLSWGLGFIMACCYDYVKGIMGAAVPLFFFAACCLVSVVFEWFVIFETKGMKLEEIQQKLGA